jgi:hypothetical protein
LASNTIWEKFIAEIRSQLNEGGRARGSVAPPPTFYASTYNPILLFGVKKLPSSLVNEFLYQKTDFSMSSLTLAISLKISFSCSLVQTMKKTVLAEF